MGNSPSGYETVETEQALRPLVTPEMDMGMLISAIRNSIGCIEPWTRNRYSFQVPMRVPHDANFYPVTI
jgi:hypothetical protein